MKTSNLSDYIECALWSSSHSENGEDIPFDQMDASLSTKAIKQMNEDLSGFMELVTLLRTDENESIFPSDSQIAHDFWLTRNGHGAGFWDRELGDLGDELTALCEHYGPCDLELGDDGLIYLF